MTSVIDQLRTATKDEVRSDDFDAFLAFAATFYTNAGNYKVVQEH